MENKNTNKTPISKPITVVQTELANGIIDKINSSGLHPVIIMPGSEEIYLMMKNTLKETREKEKSEYEKSVAESNKINESKSFLDTWIF